MLLFMGCVFLALGTLCVTELPHQNDNKLLLFAAVFLMLACSACFGAVFKSYCILPR